MVLLPQHVLYSELARKCNQPCAFQIDRPNVQQRHSKKLNKSEKQIHLQQWSIEAKCHPGPTIKVPPFPPLKFKI